MTFDLRSCFKRGDSPSKPRVWGIVAASPPRYPTHSLIRRTQSYIKVLATHLQGHLRFARALTNQAIELIVKSASLHDIGKVGIPDSILLKPGRLTTEEWDVMKTHSCIGSDAIKIALQGALDDEEYQFLHAQGSSECGINDLVMQGLQQIPLILLRVAMEIAHWHHERWDGTGYPDGLAGEDIPFSARLMALADVFDALISHRVYKRAIPIGHVVEIIAAGRGSHFDPDIVDAFLSVRERFQTIAERYADSEADIQAKIAARQGKILTT